jgi:CRP/FNR family transcriptional regulator, cyclic AMP receptor protein
VFYIQTGKVKITVTSEQGKEAVVAVLGPDEFCGEGCLTGQPLRLATATTITECEIMRLEKAVMLRVLHEEPAFSELFVSHLLARTIRVEADLVDNCSIPARSAWHGPFFYWLILVRTVDPSRSSPRSAKRRSRR